MSSPEYDGKDKARETDQAKAPAAIPAAIEDAAIGCPLGAERKDRHSQRPIIRRLLATGSIGRVRPASEASSPFHILLSADPSDDQTDPSQVATVSGSFFHAAIRYRELGVQGVQIG